MDQPELVMLEIAQPAMHELGGGRRGARGQIVHFGKGNGVATAHSIAGNAGAIDAASDYEHIHTLGHGVTSFRIAFAYSLFSFALKEWIARD